MAIFKCKMCGGTLEINDETVAVCEYCGTQQTVAKADDEKKLGLFNRANRLRMDNEFDKAAGVYETIVSEYPEEAEGYWGLVLCSYGIEYVDDVKTGKKIPTCHRTLTTSVMDDSNFNQAFENADVVARGVYREEAKVIDRLQKKIISVVEKEEPYDVFICYKETDEITKQRTEDSSIAQDIYTELVKEGYKVFFSRVTLRGKAGSEYEPYIYAALSSAKVMLAIGTKFEYYDAVWVKNEWSRYISMMANDSSKHLIPCFKNLDAYDIPKEFKNLQALDMGEVTFFKSLIENVERFIAKKGKEQVVVNTVNATNANTEPLLKRAFMFLEDGNFQSADEYCEKVLDLDPECGKAYLGKFLVSLQTKSIEELKNKKVRKPGSAGKVKVTVKACSQSLALVKLMKDRFNLDLKSAKDLVDNMPFTRDFSKDDVKVLKSIGCVMDAAGGLEDIVTGEYENDANYKKFMKFGNKADIDELQSAIKFLLEKAADADKGEKYAEAISMILNAQTPAAIEKAIEALKTIESYKDSASYIKKGEERLVEFERKKAEHEKKRIEQTYNDAVSLAEIGGKTNLKDAIKKMGQLGEYKDSVELMMKWTQEIKAIESKEAEEAARKREAEAKRKAEENRQQEYIASKKKEYEKAYPLVKQKGMIEKRLKNTNATIEKLTAEKESSRNAIQGFLGADVFCVAFALLGIFLESSFMVAIGGIFAILLLAITIFMVYGLITESKKLRDAQKIASEEQRKLDEINALPTFEVWFERNK